MSTPTIQQSLIVRGPEWFSPLHARAMEMLSDDWRRLPDLRGLDPSLPPGSVVFDDLVAAHLAECRVEPLVRNGIQLGEKLFYRRAPKSKAVTP